LAEIEQPSVADVQAALTASINGKRSRPAWNADDLRKKLQGYDRTPFMDLLQHWATNGPTAADIEALAKKAPDKWVSAMTQMARIAGFTEKTETTINHNVNVAHMSDSQLEDEIKARIEKLSVIDVPYHDIDASAPAERTDIHANAVTKLLEHAENAQDPGDFGAGNQS
jgi:hypothetical protein